VIPTGWPTREQAALISPTAPACVPQDHLEPVLLEHLLEQPSARVWFGAEVMDVRQDAGGVDVILRDGRQVRARYLVGADGGRSAIRSAAGIEMHGPDGLEAAVSALFRAPRLAEITADKRYGAYGITHPQVDGILLPAGAGDRWMFGVILEDGQRPEEYDRARLAEMIRTASGDPGLEVHIERSGAFSFAAQVAERFRSGSVFLAGDAAHRVTPRGGTGMNTAIRSAFDLGWKLAWVVRGWASEALLDTYEGERRPVAEHNARRSADPNGTMRGAAEALRADLGGRIAHHWIAPGASTLDLVGDGLTLLTGPRRAAWDAAAEVVDGPPVEIWSLDELTARALGIRLGGALLVRPDGAPAGWFSHGERATCALREAVLGLISGTREAAVAA
jgi:2-polyprenyl-6-methoxyphenol hydroxylase-like FAD-dependent oxidoreductase